MHNRTSTRNTWIYSPSNFWFEDPSALFQTFDVIPNQDMTDAERLNAMTRVIILITAVMFIVKFPLWWMFLVIGIIAVIVLWYIVKGRDELYADQVRRQTEYLRRPRKSIIQTYQGTRKATASHVPRVDSEANKSLSHLYTNQILSREGNIVSGRHPIGRRSFQSSVIQSVQTQPLKLISIP